MKKILLILLITFFCNITVEAASLCSYQEQNELNQKAANVKATYEIKKYEEWLFDGYYSEYEIVISLLNLTEDFDAVITNNINNEKIRINYSSVKDGVATFAWDYFDSVTNFTIELVTTNKTNCSNERYKIIYLTTPRYNKFYNKAVCSENPDYYLCEQFVVYQEITEDKFHEEITSYLNSSKIDNKVDEPSVENPTVIDYFNKYKWYAIGGFALIVIIAYIVYRIKTKKQRELGL